jgi:hypothetical protein
VHSARQGGTLAFSFEANVPRRGLRSSLRDFPRDRLLGSACNGKTTDQRTAAESHQQRGDDRHLPKTSAIGMERTAAHWSQNVPLRGTMPE